MLFKIRNKTGMPIYMTSVQLCNRSSCHSNKAGYRNKRIQIGKEEANCLYLKYGQICRRPNGIYEINLSGLMGEGSKGVE